VDLKALLNLGYAIEHVQPLDPAPHRRPLLLVAKFKLVKPLAGAEEYSEKDVHLIPGAQPLLPGDDRVPLLGSGGFNVARKTTSHSMKDSFVRPRLNDHMPPVEVSQWNPTVLLGKK